MNFKKMMITAIAMLLKISIIIYYMAVDSIIFIMKMRSGWIMLRIQLLEYLMNLKLQISIKIKIKKIEFEDFKIKRFIMMINLWINLSIIQHLNLYSEYLHSFN